MTASGGGVVEAGLTGRNLPSSTAGDRSGVATLTPVPTDCHSIRPLRASNRVLRRGTGRIFTLRIRPVSLPLISRPANPHKFLGMKSTKTSETDGRPEVGTLVRDADGRIGR